MDKGAFLSNYLTMKAGTRHRSWMHFLPSSKFPLSNTDQKRKNIKFETIFSTSSDNGEMLSIIIVYYFKLEFQIHKRIDHYLITLHLLWKEYR